MTDLPTLPDAPENVKYALTVPQSVLFADLSLRGSLASCFLRVFGINYEPPYIAIDDGAMSWDFSPSDPFISLLVDSDQAVDVIPQFLEVMGRTSRDLVRKASILAPPARRRASAISGDLAEDLGRYWDAYEAHMASLYTFWNVETLLTEELVEALRNDGHQDEIDSGLSTFIRPSEPNWFAFEQANLATMQRRFSDAESSSALEAAQVHVDQFGFLLAPFNLGEPPSAAAVLERMASLKLTEFRPVVRRSEPNFSPRIEKLGWLERQLSFWKTERLDAFALADQLAQPLYKDLSEFLGAPLASIFSMTRPEIQDALAGRKLPDPEVLATRSEAYCLALVDGVIRFYEPTRRAPGSDKEDTAAASGAILVGAPASPGVVRGRVRIVVPGEQPDLQSDEVIVTKMTRPDMGAALDIAVAYITDEGGRLSHAAIVSREKHKPCVVGVGNATKVLRPGMLVEVDGDRGRVTVLDASFLDERP